MLHMKKNKERGQKNLSDERLISTADNRKRSRGHKNRINKARALLLLQCRKVF